MERRISYLSNTVIPDTKRVKNQHVFNVFTQVGVKQLTDFLRTVTSASDLVDCTLVNCVFLLYGWCYLRNRFMSLYLKKGWSTKSFAFSVPLSQQSSRGHTPKLAKASR